MSFQPYLPHGGFAGWSFLKATGDSQRLAYNSGPEIKRATEYLGERLPLALTADQLVSDPRLLRIVLTGFGLERDAPNAFFIRKVLEEGTFDPQSLANRLPDRRYFALSRALGYGDLDPPNVVLSSFVEGVKTAYSERRFEAALGQRDPGLQLLMGFRREISALTDQSRTPDALWYSILGTPPVLRVLSTAFGLPQTVGVLDIDRQMSLFRGKALSLLGIADPSDLTRPSIADELSRLYLSRSTISAGIASGSATRGAVALALLRANPNLS